MRRAVGALVVLLALAVTTIASEPTPLPATAAAPVSVAFVGDSIGRDAEPEIRTFVGPPITYYHAIAAGYTAYHRPRLLEQVRRANGPDVVVAELGTGDAFWSHGARRFEAEMRRTLDRLAPHVECVIWIDQKSSDNRAYPMINERYRKLNAVVHRVVEDYDFATYLHYAHWTELAGPRSPNYFLADWLHLTQAGERELGRLVASAVRGCDDAQVSGPFWDVPDSFWAADAINWAAAEGLVTGYDNDTYRAVVGQFRPPVTRGQGLAMVWRLMGSPNEPAPHGFVDGRPALRRALRWGRANGVATGYRDGTYRPDAPLTRGALLMMLWKAVGRSGGLPDHPWAQTVPARLRNAVRWAVAAGVVNGAGPSARHRAAVNRAQAAVWLQATDAFLHPPAPPAPPAPPTSSVPTTAPTTTGIPPATTAPTSTSATVLTTTP